MEDLNNNDPLEELFKSKSEQYDISYREEDWQALEHRLDAADAQRTQRNRRWLTAAAVLIVFSLLGYFTYQNYQQINSLNEQLSQTEQTTNNPSQPSLDEQEPTTTPTDAQDEQQDDQGSQQIQGEDDAVNNAEVLTDNKDTSAPPRENSTEDNTQAITRNPVDHLAVSQLNCENCRFVAQDSIKNMRLTPSSLSMIRSEQPTTLFAAAVPPTSENRSTYRSSVAVKPNRPKTSFGFVLGPDLSTVGSVSNFYNPGYKIGLTADFNIGQNFTISVGAIRSDVRYKASGLQYQFSSQGYGNTTIQTDQTVGKCILIDIPIQLSYKFLHFDHSRLYASAGLSSYIMLNEDYQFDFNSNPQGYPDRWQGDTGTTHLFSNASISVGYEFDLGRRLSLRAEPFLKIPLKEVGRADVNLYSVGSLVSINYHLY